MWFGAKSLQAIRSPNSFRLSFLPSPVLNLSTDQVIQPHGLQLAKTRHILLGTFNTKCVRFAAFLFFPNAAASKTPTIKNALSSERQKDLYNRIIIPAAHEAISGPPLQEIPQTYEIAYAKSRSFQEKPGNNRWRTDDMGRSFHLQYTIPAQFLMSFWQSIVRRADSLRIPTESGETVAYFQNPRLLFQSHDLKNTFGCKTLEETLSLFEDIVLQAFDPALLDIRSSWLDIGFRDHVPSHSPQSLFRPEPYTLLWKSQCHRHLHTKLSRVSPEARLDATYFRGFLFRDVGDYQAKAKAARGVNPGHPEQSLPAIIRGKAYNCNKEQASVMFSNYQLFQSGFLPLLALNEGMIKDLSSTNQGNQEAPMTQLSRESILKAWNANKRHLRAISDKKSLANYGIRKEMTFRLDTILTMWAGGYFNPNQNPHVGQLSWNMSLTPDATEHYPFWIVSTEDVNSLIFTQAARFIVPLDHLFRQASLSAAHSSPYLILAFYTSQLFCRLLTYCLQSERQFPYDNWIWLSRWTVQHRQAHHKRTLLVRQGLGLETSTSIFGMLWIPRDCIDWHAGHIDIRTLSQLYVPRTPIQARFTYQANIQSFTTSRVSVEHSLKQWLQDARLEYDRGNNREAERIVDGIIRLAVEEIARAYHHHMLSKLQSYWSRIFPRNGRNGPPPISRLRQGQDESAKQVGRIVNAQTIWEIYNESWSVFAKIHSIAESEQMPREIPCWMAKRKYLPHEDGWSEYIFRQLFGRPNPPTWNRCDFLKLYRRFKELWEMICDRAGSFDNRFRRVIGNFIQVAFNSDQSKEIVANRSLGTWYEHKPTFFRIQFWAPYFSLPESRGESPKCPVDDYQSRNLEAPLATTCVLITNEQFRSRADTFKQLWLQIVTHGDRLQAMKPKARNQICQEALQCLIELTGVRWTQNGDLKYILPWKFESSTAKDDEFEDPFRIPISSKTGRFASRPHEPTIILPSHHNAVTLTDAILSLPRLSQKTLRQLQCTRMLLDNNSDQYDIRTYLEARWRAREAVTQSDSLLRQFLSQTEPPQTEIEDPQALDM